MPNTDEVVKKFSNKSCKANVTSLLSKIRIL